MTRRTFLAVCSWLASGAIGLSPGRGGHRFQTFLDRFPPDAKPTPLGRRRVSAAQAPHVHPLLRSFWEEVGFGSFGDGFLHMVHPDDYNGILSKWLLREGEVIPDRIPFARTGLGDLIYFRDLRGLEATEAAASPWPDEHCDVTFLSVHHRDSAEICWGMAPFFEGGLADFFDDVSGTYQGLYREARHRHPRADSKRCFFFVPALALGGSPAAETLEVGDCQVHLDFLYQLATAADQESQESSRTAG